MTISEEDEITAENLRVIALFASQNCTGASGVIGDTILQTSLVRTLLDRSLFPQLEKVHWWGVEWVVKDLFGYLKAPLVEMHDWDESIDGLPSVHYIKECGIEATLICTRNEDVVSKLKADLHPLPCFEPANPLDAQSSTHLCHQLHSCLSKLGIYVADLPHPRIGVTETEIENVRSQMTQEGLKKGSIEWSEGKQPFKPGVDQVFLINPGVSDVPDNRTWPWERWKALVSILAEIGVVIVYYDPNKSDQERAARNMISGKNTFKGRFAKGFGLRDLAAWACASTVCIVRDSGPMHVMAYAVGPTAVPRVLGLFSVMCPDTWKPLGENFEALGQWPLPLEPYLTPDQVAVKAVSLTKR